MKVFLERRGDAQCLLPFGAVEGVPGDGVPESGAGKKVCNDGGVLHLKKADQISGDADLQAMEAGACAEGVEGVRNEMLAAAGRAGGSRDGHGNAIKEESAAEEFRPREIVRGVGDELVNAGVGEQRGEVVHGGACGVEGEFPIGDGSEFGGEITDAGVPEMSGGAEADGGI